MVQRIWFKYFYTELKYYCGFTFFNLFILSVISFNLECHVNVGICHCGKNPSTSDFSFASHVVIEEENV